MTQAIFVRQAILSDAQAVSQLYQSQVNSWQPPNGIATYEQLSLYERWQHGGPWMSLETCSIWLGYLLQRHDHIPLVAEYKGKVLGEAEVFIGHEPTPYGHHIHISSLCVHRQAEGQGIGRALIEYIAQMGTVLGCQRITVSQTQPENFYRHLQFSPLTAFQNLQIDTEQGRVFYKANPLANTAPEQIKGWHMPMGRFQNGRAEWERMTWSIWNGVPQLVEAEWHRFKIDITAQPAVLHLHELDSDRQIVTARVWTQHPLSNHVVSAVRDRAARLGYQSLFTRIETQHEGLFADAKLINDPDWLFSRPITP